MQRPILLLALAAGFASGCGSGKHPVNGTVTYEGQTVAKATVVFTSDIGNVATGFTDDSGNFSLLYLDKPGIPAGTYKVTVTKTKIVEGRSPAEIAESGGGTGGPDKEYLAKMKAKAAPQGPTAGTKTDVGELPAIYASVSNTPLEVKVPSDGPVKLELKKK
jgi:hypothetical protein